MSIIEYLDKIKPRILPWLLPLNIILVGMFGYGVGRLVQIEEAKTPVLIEGIEGASGISESLAKSFGTNEMNAKALVGSKNGTKYHYPWCSGAQRIKEENKIWFSSAEEAKRAGYSAASNCPGL